MTNKELDRRNFIKATAAAFTVAGGLMLVKYIRGTTEKEENNEWQTIEPNTIEKLRFFTFVNFLENYPVAINESVLESLALEYDIPLENSENINISLLAATKLNSDNDFSIITITPDNKVEIQIAGGAIEKEVVKLSGKKPDDWKDQRFMSIVLSDSIFSCLASLGYLSGYYSEEVAKNKSASYLNYLLSVNNPLFVAQILVKESLPASIA
jgi:hypothetical protein